MGIGLCHTYRFQYYGHGEEGVSELHSPEQSDDEVSLATAHTVVLQNKRNPLIKTVPHQLINSNTVDIIIHHILT